MQILGAEPSFRAPTLGEIWLIYQKYRKLKPATLEDYAKRLKYVTKWSDLPITEISKDMVEERHRELTSSGPANADLVFRVVRALYIFAGCKFDELHGVNPVKRLSELRAWNRLDPRESSIKPDDIAAWFEAVLIDENDTVRDLHILWMLSGLRRVNGSSLPWKRVDFKARTLFIPKEEAKNHREQTLPMGTYLTTMLSERRERRPDDIWVFPGDEPSIHISETNKSYQRIAKRAGIKFSPHDLRRTFLSIADECEIPMHIQKRLVNHKQTDITERYHCPSVERLRKPMQQIEDCILGYAGLLS